MANQMTPAELRAAAEKLTTPFHGDDRVVSAPDDREWWNALKAARDATRRLADVIEVLEAGDCDGARRAVLGER